MSELIIDNNGDVRLNYEFIGTIHWERPTAYYDAAKLWHNDPPECPVCEGEYGWDQMVEDLSYERYKNARLSAQLAEVRAMLGVRR